MAKHSAKEVKERKTRRASRVIIEDDAQDDDDALSGRFESADDIEDSEKLSEFLDQFGGKEYKVRVDRMHSADKVWEYVETYPYDGFDAYETCKRHGPGRYRLTILNERGKYVKGGQPQLRIAGVLKPDAPQGVAAPAEAQDPMKHPTVVLMMTMMEKSNSQTTELLKAMLAKPEPQKSSATEVLDLFKSVRAMAPEDPMKKVQEALMMKMIERGFEGGGSNDAGEKSAWQEILEGLKDAKDLGIIDKLLGGMKRPAPRPAPAQPAAPATPSVTVALAHQPQEAPTVTTSPILEALRPLIPLYKVRAENKVAPADAADGLVDDFYNVVIPTIRQHVKVAKFMSEAAIAEYAVTAAQDPEEVAKLYSFAPELEPHREWVAATIAEAVKLMTTEQEPEDASNADAAAA